MQMEDFIGFSFNGVHSTELGIKRASDGSRYNENLLPTFQDRTVQVPGGNGTYYFGSQYTQRQISVSFAFDALTEEMFMRLRSVFSDQEIHELWFDEAPYKIYSAKVQAPPTIKYICFDVKGERIYKGEGSVNFICYYPFAKAKYRFLEDYFEKDGEGNPTTVPLYSNMDEWKDESGLVRGLKENNLPYYDLISVDRNWKTDNGEIRKNIDEKIRREYIYIYNTGDKPTYLKLYFRFPYDDNNNDNERKYLTHSGFTVSLYKGIGESEVVNEDGAIAILSLKDIAPKGTDNFFCLDFKNHLILGGKDENQKGATSGPEMDITEDFEFSTNTYNEYIENGNFFEVPVNKDDNLSTFTVSTVYSNFESYECLGIRKIDYDILYI